MKTRDYHANITIYGLNKDVSKKYVISWLKKTIKSLESKKLEWSDKRIGFKLSK
jgi:hypothetical protein